MKITKVICKLIVSILLWIVLAIPRLIIFAINIIVTILNITSRTISYLIKQIEDEIIK